MSFARSANLELIWWIALLTMAATLTAFVLHVPAY
jgi:hypothetical protein